MRFSRHSLRSAAVTDVVFLVGMAPASLAPVSIAELHLYAYLANLVALHRGVPVSDWGYRFAVTTEGFPFADALAEATENLAQRSVVEVEGGRVKSAELFGGEFGVLDGLAQSARRKSWLGAAIACALHLPRGAVRDAINRTPGVATSLRHRRASSLLESTEIEEIYSELAAVRKVLGEGSEDLIQPVVVWLSARVVAQGRR